MAKVKSFSRNYAKQEIDDYGKTKNSKGNHELERKSNLNSNPCLALTIWRPPFWRPRRCILAKTRKGLAEEETRKEFFV